MAIKTFYVAAGNDGNYGALVDGTAQAAANRTDGWTVGKITAANGYSDYDVGVKQATGTFSATLKPTALLTGASANAFKTPAPLTGVFATGTFVFSFAVRATLVSAQAGNVQVKIYKGPNADGSGATDITGSNHTAASPTGTLSTTADATLTVNITMPAGAANRTFNNEYLFIVIAWKITTQGGSNSADCLIRTGSTGPAGSRLVTTDFTATNNWVQPVNDTVALSDARTRISTYKRTPGDALVLADVRTRVISAKRTLADPVVLTDARTVSKGKTRQFSDSVLLSDARTRTMAKVRTQADSVALSDSTTKNFISGSAWKRNIKVYL